MTGGIVKRVEAVIARQRPVNVFPRQPINTLQRQQCPDHCLAKARTRHATVKERLEAVFSVWTVPRL
jgi:hypothetical protein